MGNKNNQPRPPAAEPLATQPAAAAPLDKTSLIALVVALTALAGTLSSAYFQYAASNRASDVRMVEIGIGILRAPVNEDITAIRPWAMDLIEKSSGEKFTPAQKIALERHALPFVDAWQAAPSWMQGIPSPCSAFRRNEDGSWTQIGKVVLPGNNTMEGNRFKGTAESKFLDQWCLQN
jgi:hypothetical protein